jgi:katanin p60 ATPase-containing subunit A1
VFLPPKKDSNYKEHNFYLYSYSSNYRVLHFAETFGRLEMSTSLKVKLEAKTTEDKINEERRRNLLILIMGHLMDQGYSDSAERLQSECGISLSDYEPADNVDMISILQEYEAYYYVKFNKKPKLVRRCHNNSGPKRREEQFLRDHYKDKEKAIDPKAVLPKIKNAALSPRNTHSEEITAPVPSKSTHDLLSLRKPSHSAPPTSKPLPSEVGSTVTPKEGSNSSSNTTTTGPSTTSSNSTTNTTATTTTTETTTNNNNSSFTLQGKAVTTKKKREEDLKNAEQQQDDLPVPKPFLPPEYRHNLELRELAALITRDIFSQSLDVGWDDIVGLEEGKSLLKEAIVMPMKYPEVHSKCKKIY